MTRPVKIRPNDIKDGKITVQPRKPRSVSEAIRQKKSTRQKVVRRQP